MASVWDKLKKVLETPFAVPVYYFASLEQEPLREAATLVRTALEQQGDDTDYTRLDGPAVEMGEVIASAGTISLFGTRRIVELREITVASLTDKDAAELAALFTEVENAVLLLTVLHKDKRTAGTKKAKLLQEAAAKAGFAAELAKPTARENLQYISKTAKEYGAEVHPRAAQALLERAGEDRPLLRNEIAKLAAMVNYQEITEALVERYAVHNVEADAFQMVRLITSGRQSAALEKLDELIALRQEPIAITAALAGTYVDMYRVRCGTEQYKSIATIASEMGYRGSDYRLQKAKENAARYTTKQLEKCILCLYELDAKLKSSAMPDKSVLLQAAVADLMQIGAKR